MSRLNEAGSYRDGGVLYDSRGCVISSLATDEKVIITPDMCFLETDISTAFMGDHFQYGFPIGGGGLAVKDADNVVPVALKVHGMFPKERKYRAMDVHRRGHISFASSFNPRVDPRLVPFFHLTSEVVREWGKDSPVVSPHFGRDYLLEYLDNTIDGGQVLWWEHGLENTEQALPHPLLRDIACRVTITKGLDPLCDSYSPFKDNLGRTTRLGEIITRHGWRKMVTGGIAYDICAGLGAVAAAEDYGFQVVVVKSMCRPVSEAGEKAMDARLLKLGLRIVQDDQLELAA